MDAPTCLVRDFFVNYINSHNKNLDDLPYFIVWGTGHFGSVVMQGCEAIGISPIAVMDSNDKKVDTDFFGFSVSSVDVALKNFPDAIVVIAIADMFAYELKKNLTKRNIKSFAFLEFFQWLASSSLLEIGPFNAPVLRGGGGKIFGCLR